LLLGTGSRRENDEQRIVDAFLEYRPDGMVLLSPRLRPSTLASLTSLTRLVVVGRTAKGIDSVMTDESTGAHLVVQHLFDLGHRAIAHIDGGAGAGAAPRRAAYVRAMKRVGLADHVHVVPGDFTEEAGAEGVRALLVDRHSLPSAIFAANDLAAAGAMDALDDAGMRVPDDVSVVGYDNTFLANLHYVSLTTVHQARYEMGQEAVRLLVERIEGTRTDVQHVLAEPTLVVRSTTGRVASRAL
jgi:DNA-binding LacI/PurR family transcriptional regulator